MACSTLGTMPRPHAAAIIEDAWNRRKAGLLADRGWGFRLLPFTGYGSPMFVRVLGRVVMTRPDGGTARTPARAPHLEGDDRRGWRSFFTAPVGDASITVVVGDQRVAARSDRSGLIDVTVRGHGLAPGWRRIRIEADGARPVEADVLIVGSRVTFGIVSDIDDTVLSTSLPRPLIAAWNTFLRTEGSRRPVSGMATLYRELRAVDAGIPVFYVSTGAWNTAPQLRRFMRRNGLPEGPMLLTDWGPTQTGWFRSGQQHKQASLHRLARDYPQISWLLVGDDGQHDPKIYAAFAKAKPASVMAIAIRELSTGEQVLSHGLPVANDQLDPAPVEELSVPVVRAPDGYGLARQLRPLVATVRARRGRFAVDQLVAADDA